MASAFIPSSPLALHLRNVMLRHIPRAWLGKYLASGVRSEIALASDGAA